MRARRLMIALSTAALALPLAVVLPATDATALPCISWHTTLAYDSVTDEHVNTLHCDLYLQEPGTRPPMGRPDGQPGTGGRGGFGDPAPGSKASCEEVATSIQDLEAEIDRLGELQQQLADELDWHETTLATAVQRLRTAIGQRVGAEQDVIAAIAEFEDEGGEIDPGADNRGKPPAQYNLMIVSGGNLVANAQRQLARFIAEEGRRRAEAGAEAQRVLAVRERVAANARAGTSAQRQLEAAIQRQIAEKCKP